MTRNHYIIAALSILAVLLATCYAYWPGLYGPFLLDDFQNIVADYVDYFEGDKILYVLTHNESGDLGRPVSVMSLLFSGIVHGLDPWGYKYHNLAIHLITGLLLFWLLLLLLPRLSREMTRERTVLVAGLTAAIWLLHPLMVSTVLYAVQRMAQLAALFTLAALIAFLYARELAAGGGVRFYVVGWVVFPLLSLLALLSKENGALIAFYILAIEFIAFRDGYSGTAERNRVAVFLAVFAVIPILAGTAFVLTHFDQVSDYSLRTFTLSERLLTQLHIVALYLKMILLPRLSDMTLFHDYIQVRSGFDPLTSLLFLLLLAALALVFILRRSAPVVAFAIAWFLVSHLMESTIISLELMFEHRNYLAAAGPLFVVVYYLCNVAGFPKLQYVNLAVLALLAMLTMVRVFEWRNSDTIFQVALAEHPDSFRALTLMANLKYNAGEIDQARELLVQAQLNDEKGYGAMAHEAIYRCQSGEDVEGLLARAAQKAALYPASTYSLNVMDNLVSILYDGRCPELQPDAVLGVVQAAKTQAGNMSNETYLGYLERIEGQLYILKGDFSRGIGLTLAAYEHTGLVMILANLADVLLQLGLYDDAEYIIGLVEAENEKNGGTETALLKPLQDALATARATDAAATATPEEYKGEHSD